MFTIFASANVAVASDLLGVSGRLSVGGAIQTAGGLAVGNAAVHPDSGAIYLQARTTTVTPSGGGAMLWVQSESGVQKLYVKFGNGVVRQLATA